MNKVVNIDSPERNPDPITHAPGSHPLGTTLGAVAGAAGAVTVGAIIGSAVGPIGTAVGAAAGVVVGALAGKGIAEEVNPTIEDAYWRQTFTTRPYYVTGQVYEDYGPAYKYGWESKKKNHPKRFDDMEAELGRHWVHFQGTSKLSWDHAKLAARDALNRTVHGKA